MERAAKSETLLPQQPPDLPKVIQVRSARTGSIRVARQAGSKQETSATIVMTTKARPNASGSRGLTLQRSWP
jgi:hypothetical protein